MFEILIAIGVVAEAEQSPSRPPASACSPIIAGTASSEARHTAVAHLEAQKRAQHLLDTERWAEAETILRCLTLAAPNSSGVQLRLSLWGQLAEALRHQNKFEEAIPVYERILKLQGAGPAYLGWHNARYGLAVSHLAIGHKAAALTALEKLVWQDGLLQRQRLWDDPLFASLQTEKEFAALTGRMPIGENVERLQGWKLDIAYLSEEVTRNTGRSLSSTFLARRAALLENLPYLDDLQIVGGLSGMLATLDQGHTSLWLDASTSQRLDYRPVPVLFYAFEDGLFIMRGFDDAAALTGAKVLNFGTTSTVKALEMLSENLSLGSPQELLWLGPNQLRRPAFLYGLGIIDRPERLELELEMPDGSTRRVDLAVDEEQDLGALRQKLVAPPGVQAPKFLAKHDVQTHWFEDLDEADATYVQVNNMMDETGESLTDFGLRLRDHLATTDPSNVILDLRHNNGGNSFRYVELLRTLIDYSARADHRLYVLIGRNVCSSAGNFTSDLERLADPIFVGEETSQFGNQAGDESVFQLPYSGLMGAVSGVRWQLSYPWDGRRAIAPHVPVPMTSKDYFSGRDPVLEGAIALIEAGLH